MSRWTKSRMTGVKNTRRKASSPSLKRPPVTRSIYGDTTDWSVWDKTIRNMAQTQEKVAEMERKAPIFYESDREKYEKKAEKLGGELYWRGWYRLPSPDDRSEDIFSPDHDEFGPNVAIHDDGNTDDTDRWADPRTRNKIEAILDRMEAVESYSWSELPNGKWKITIKYRGINAEPGSFTEHCQAGQYDHLYLVAGKYIGKNVVNDGDVVELKGVIAEDCSYQQSVHDQLLAYADMLKPGLDYNRFRKQLQSDSNEAARLILERMPE